MLVGIVSVLNEEVWSFWGNLGRQCSRRPCIVSYSDLDPIVNPTLNPSGNELCCRPSGEHAYLEPATGKHCSFGVLGFRHSDDAHGSFQWRADIWMGRCLALERVSSLGQSLHWQTPARNTRFTGSDPFTNRRFARRWFRLG